MKHRSKILTAAYWLASREAAAIFVCLGILSQFAHVYYITYDISSLPGVWRVVQAAIMSLFFSFGLSFFILRGVEEDDYSSENLRGKKLITYFTWVEAIINLAYWGGHLIYEPMMAGQPVNWFQFGISIPFAILIPVLLKAYGFSVLVNKPSIEEPEPATPVVEPTQVMDVIREQMDYQHQMWKKENDERNALLAKTLDELNNKPAPSVNGEYQLKFVNESGKSKVLDVELQPLSETVVDATGEIGTNEQAVETPFTEKETELETLLDVEPIKESSTRKLTIDEEIALETQSIATNDK